MKRAIFITLLMFLPLQAALAAPGLDVATVTPGAGGSQTYTVSIQTLLFMTLLSMLPAALLMMTSFTRIIIVLAILRQALGTGATPTNQTLIGLALFLTFFIMSPVFDKVNQEALQPYMEEKIPASEAINNAKSPFMDFMLKQTRESDLELFTRISGKDGIESPEAVPFSLLVPAFVTSELKTAFQIGFLIFIPFLIIDIVVSSVLMSMGMMMLSPMVISLPFKIMLFVLVDGWSLIIGTLAASFS
ncbi:MAG: flagellar type III secretion system pore protein FliP [Gammaproteobacteria bacterium]|nr:flagellar type III secretion system pore protein FliP [Gammaproteobacteria bacterium]